MRARIERAGTGGTGRIIEDCFFFGCAFAFDPGVEFGPFANMKNLINVNRIITTLSCPSCLAALAREFQRQSSQQR